MLYVTTPWYQGTCRPNKEPRVSPQVPLMPKSKVVLETNMFKSKLLIACYITLNAAKVDPPQNIGLGH